MKSFQGQQERVASREKTPIERGSSQWLGAVREDAITAPHSYPAVADQHKGRAGSLAEETGRLATGKSVGTKSRRLQQEAWVQGLGAGPREAWVQALGGEERPAGRTRQVEVVDGECGALP